MKSTVFGLLIGVALGLGAGAVIQLEWQDAPKLAKQAQQIAWLKALKTPTYSGGTTTTTYVPYTTFQTCPQGWTCVMSKRSE